jgi:hypothetical protein
MKLAKSSNKAFQKLSSAAPHVICSFPKELYDKMKHAIEFGQQNKNANNESIDEQTMRMCML